MGSMRRITCILALAALASLAFPCGAHPRADEGLPARHAVRGVSYIAQSSANTCGAAVLAMVLSHVERKEVSEADVLKLHPEIAEKGTWIPLLWEIAEAGGFVVERGEGTTETLKRLLSEDKPVVVYQWATEERKREHFRVVIGYDDSERRFIVHDPGAPKGEAMRISYGEFEKLWELSWYTDEDGRAHTCFYLAITGRKKS